MRIRIARTVKDNGRPVAYTVKIGGKKFPKGHGNFYFPKNGKKRAAILMALIDHGSESSCDCEEGNVNVSSSKESYLNREEI